MSKIYNAEEFASLFDDICNKLQIELMNANRMGELDKILQKYNLKDDDYYCCCEQRLAKILVLGQSEVKENDLIQIAKTYGFEPNRFEFILDYNDASNYDMSKLYFSTKYSDIFVGPIAHKTVGMGNCSSIISKIEHDPSSYPKLSKLLANGELKITKTSFREALTNSQLLYLLKNI